MSLRVPSTRLTMPLSLALLIAGLVLPLYSTAAPSAKTALSPRHSWQHEQVGHWVCRGSSTLATGSEQPYAGHLTNHWSADRSVLILRFEEDHAAGAPFQETQEWAYAPTLGTHTRSLVTNAGAEGLLRASEPEGNHMVWEGPFGTSGSRTRLAETLTRITEREYRWYGEVVEAGHRLGYYQLVCQKIAP